MSKRHYAALTSFLEANGYQYLRTNAKGYSVYRNSSSERHTIVSVQQGITDAQAGHMIENISKELGIPVKQAARKRSGKAVKEQHERKREREAEAVQRDKDELAALRKRKEAELNELRAERATLIAEANRQREERERQLGGLAKYLTNDEVASIEEHIARKERELLEWQTELVGGRLTTNQYRHQA